MTSHETHVDRPTGPVNTGSGSQYVLYGGISEYERLMRGRRSLHTPRADVDWLERRFVVPPGHDEARRRLEQTSTAVLTGLPGVGRRSAAMMLLGHGFQELSDTADEFERFVAVYRTVATGDRYLLDLTRCSDTDLERIRRALPPFRAEVEQHGARLVVLPSYQDTHLSANDLQAYVAEIGRPPARDVFLRHLRADGIDVADADLANQRLESVFASAPMREVARLATLVRGVRHAEPAAGFAAWLGKAREAFEDRATHAADLARGCSAQEKALLLCSAMLGGTPADAVFHATDLLTGGARSTQGFVEHVLVHQDFALRLKRIEATVDSDRRLVFRGFADDVAVRWHFWNQYPTLRPTLREWVGQTVELPELDRDDRDVLVARFAEQCLRTGELDEIKALVAQLTASRECLQQAELLLSVGLAHEQHDGWFRKLIYDWSCDDRLGRDLADVLVRVCARVMASTRPEQAMVRLHQLARREHRRGVTDARTALLRLTTEDPRFFRRLLSRLAERLTESRRWPYDLLLFLDVADPRHLTRTGLVDEKTVGENLTACWRAVMSRGTAELWLPYVRTWLRADEDGPRDGRLLTILVDAAADDADVLGHLYAAAWERRSETGTRLITMIDAVQGIEFEVMA